MTATKLNNSINGRSDLPGRAVGTWSGYHLMLAKYQIPSTSYEW